MSTTNNQSFRTCRIQSSLSREPTVAEEIKPFVIETSYYSQFYVSEKKLDSYREVSLSQAETQRETKSSFQRKFHPFKDYLTEKMLHKFLVSVYELLKEILKIGQSQNIPEQKKLDKKLKKQYNKAWYLKYNKNFNKIVYDIPICHPNEMGMKYAGYNVDAKCAAKNRLRKEKYNILNPKKNIAEDHIRAIKEKDVSMAYKRRPNTAKKLLSQSYENNLLNNDSEYEFSKNGKHYKKRNEVFENMNKSDLGSLIHKIDSDQLTWKSNRSTSAPKHKQTKYDNNPYFRGALKRCIADKQDENFQQKRFERLQQQQKITGVKGYNGPECTNKHQRVCSGMLRKGYESQLSEQHKENRMQNDISVSLKCSNTRPTTAQSFFGTKKKSSNTGFKYKTVTMVERMTDKQIELSNRANFNRASGGYYLDVDNDLSLKYRNKNGQDFMLNEILENVDSIGHSSKIDYINNKYSDWLGKNYKQYDFKDQKNKSIEDKESGRLEGDSKFINNFFDHIEDQTPMHFDYRKTRVKSAVVKKRVNSATVKKY